ncbi:hypothetical protein COCMIDRAFT_111189 [Bipolaris oryzae ATCC 44560]|uniref:Uncharacterized protein n=1 Tax=Bipolaris oryzae ATCC 44560 TaxID=930090 RepID=W6Z7B0_COCMI|nr:uncharacterized protein COCMIDRAFT_111189 [Bipolaris oryzae ATCC 44560]EUC39576.1 hypothetical protein COCMIDRAFT_111189 [Bipolaris oryzae ATCC 44560]
MASFMLFSLTICFSVGLILISPLAFLDIRNLFRAETQVSEYDYRWEKIMRITFDTGSIGLEITGLVAIATAPHSIEKYFWLDAVIMSNLQLLTSNNLARMLQIFILPPWTIWAVHLVAVLTILDVVAAVTGKTISASYESALLTRFAVASFLSLALSHKQLETHKNSGSERRDEEYMRVLHAFIFANAAAASSQLCSAVFTSSFSLGYRSTSTKLRQGLFIACTATQFLCYLPFYINRIWRRTILPISSWMEGIRHFFAGRFTENDNF